MKRKVLRRNWKSKQHTTSGSVKMLNLSLKRRSAKNERQTLGKPTFHSTEKNWEKASRDLLISTFRYVRHRHEGWSVSILVVLKNDQWALLLRQNFRAKQAQQGWAIAVLQTSHSISPTLVQWCFSPIALFSRGRPCTPSISSHTSTLAVIITQEIASKQWRSVFLTDSSMSYFISTLSSSPVRFKTLGKAAPDISSAWKRNVRSTIFWAFDHWHLRSLQQPPHTTRLREEAARASSRKRRTSQHCYRQDLSYRLKATAL